MSIDAVIGKDGTVFKSSFDAWGEAYSLYCPVPCAGIKAQLHLPVVCDTPGGCYVAFYLGFNNDIEAGVSRADKFPNKWDCFMNSTPVATGPSANYKQPTTQSLASQAVELHLYIKDAKAYFAVDGHIVNAVSYRKKQLPYVKMTIAVSDARNGYYDQVWFKVLKVTIPNAKPTAPAIPKNWVRHRAHGPNLAIPRMSVPSLDPKSYGNALPKLLLA